MVIGFVKEKDLESILPMFPKEAVYYFCSPKIDRGLSVKLLEEKASNFGLKGISFSSVKEALAKAQEEAQESDFIYVGGSTFVVAEVV